MKSDGMYDDLGSSSKILLALVLYEAKELWRESTGPCTRCFRVGGRSFLLLWSPPFLVGELSHRQNVGQDLNLDTFVGAEGSEDSNCEDILLLPRRA